MKIVIYQTASGKAGGGAYSEYLPKRADIWDQLADDYPEHEFVLCICYNEYGMLDAVFGKMTAYAQKIPYVMIPVDASISSIADIIQEQKPDIAIAVAIPDLPHDWNSIRDSMVAEELQRRGIKTVAYPTFTSLAVFDKWRTNIIMRVLDAAKGIGVKIAKGLYVHSDLYWTEKKNPGIVCNVYKDYVIQRIKEMNYPIIIKDAVGAGSIGLSVCNDFEKAMEVLSAENFGDVMVEEMVTGEPFGTEIHGIPGHYSVLPPVKFSINEDGVIDPFSNIKYGPVTNEKYHIKELQDTLRKVAEELGICVTAQVDLIFKDGEWYIIEINPRWSGSSATMAAMEERNQYTMFFESGMGIGKDYSEFSNLKYVLNFKSPDIEEEKRRAIMEAYPCVKALSKSHIPLSETESLDYCEIVIGGFETKEALMEALLSIAKDFDGVVSDAVIKNVEIIAAQA